MKNIDSIGHVTGKSIYLDDIPTINGTLYGIIFDSPVAHGTIESIDYSRALAMKGVVAILDFNDISGENQIGGIFPELAHAANELGLPAHELQKKNLLREGNEFPYGQIAEGVGLTQIWADMETKFDIKKSEQKVATFNAINSDKKKGLSLQPIAFGISFTKTPMNQTRALVHIYSDGSVGVSTGTVEMGQGINTKMLQVAAEMFSINPSRVKLESTNTTRVANTSPTAASATADLNGKTLQKACNALWKG